MSLQFHILASGSSGNACVLETRGFGVLIDFGLSPRQLAPRMKRCGITWERIHAVLLTHTHSDHWQSATLTQIAKLGLPLYCHADHVNQLNQGSRAFEALSAAKLIRHYEPGTQLTLHEECECLPLELPHDGTTTCGFRFDGRSWALGYLADLGSWKPALAKSMADVDLLALEFNHDVALQLQSGRHPTLIRRVLGNHGHLSNEQAADLLGEILKRSEPGRVKHLVQLHLSRHCNRPELAHTAARQALERLGAEMSIFIADQDQKGTSIEVGKASKPTKHRRMGRSDAFEQATLPFAD